MLTLEGQTCSLGRAFTTWLLCANRPLDFSRHSAGFLSARKTMVDCSAKGVPVEGCSTPVLRVGGHRNQGLQGVELLAEQFTLLGQGERPPSVDTSY
jgi:hypothetical protein